MNASHREAALRSVEMMWETDPDRSEVEQLRSVLMCGLDALVHAVLAVAERGYE